jgi:AraC-like DNA-binding protein
MDIPIVARSTKEGATMSIALENTDRAIVVRFDSRVRHVRTESHMPDAATVIRLFREGDAGREPGPIGPGRIGPDGTGSIQQPQPNSGGLAPWQMRKVAAYVERHLGNALRVSDMALQVRLSPSHFSRAFRQSFGMAPYMHVMIARLERSRHLMLSTPQPLSHIALECGFCDQAHLSRVFNRFMGISPDAWRRRHRRR